MTPNESSLTLAALLRNDFRAFVEKCFYHLNPGQTYHDNWHVGVIAHALADCLAGKTKRLVILLPPRNLKSTIVSIAWPAFVFGHFPSMKFVCVSYSQDLAHKLSNDTRSIMISDWYRELFPGTIISPLKDTQQLFETTQHGGRFATSVGGTLTGFGGDIVIVDDPQKPIDMAHESSRHKARDWLFNTAISRFNMGSRDFSAQYQQNPLPLDGGLFNIEWFPLCEKVPEVSELIMSVDVATTDGGGNYTAVTLWGHLNHHWYLTFATRFQFDAARVRLAIIEIDRRYRPDLVVIDSGGIGKSLVAELQFQGFKHIYPSISRLSKLQRAEEIVSMIEGGRVSLLATAPKLAEFRNEIISFPNGKFDDFVDSTTQVLRFERGAVRLAQLHKRLHRRAIKSQNPYTTITAISVGTHRRLFSY
jgi:predicted phage terminase large subunit-like protein